MSCQTRRDFLGKVSGAAFGAAATAALPASNACAAVRPNILLVLADDLGYNDLGCYGQTRFSTPNIDRLAAEGVRLTAYYSGSPVCAPSRCSLLTGLHTGHAHIRDNDELPERGDVWNDQALEGQRPLLSGTTTIASVLKKAGYETALIGKWGLGGPGSEGEPNKAGFDEAFGYLCQRHAHNHYPDHLWRNGRRVAVDNPTFSAHQQFPDGADPADPRAYERYRGRQYSFDLMLDAADEFIRARRTKPFFLCLTPTVPHLALQVPEDSLTPYLGKYSETPYLGRRSYLPHFAPRAAYAAMVSRLDRGAGRLLETLQQTGQDSRTLVIFTSDNGATFDVGGFDPTFFRSNAPWRGAKQDLYEGGIRVPFIASWPGQVQAGVVRDDLAACWDLLPTLARVAGVRDRLLTDGISLWPVLEGRGSVEHDYLYWEFQGRQALREGYWKLLRDARAGTDELYDLAADPGERQNVAMQHADRVARMTRVLSAARTESPLFPLVSQRAAPAR